MSPWLLAAMGLVLCVAPLLALCLRGNEVDGVIALQMTGVITALVLLLLTEVDGDPTLADPALVVAVLALAAGLVYLHFMERWV